MVNEFLPIIIGHISIYLHSTFISVLWVWERVVCTFISASIFFTIIFSIWPDLALILCTFKFQTATWPFVSILGLKVHITFFSSQYSLEST